MGFENLKIIIVSIFLAFLAEELEKKNRVISLLPVRVRRVFGLSNTCASECILF